MSTKSQLELFQKKEIEQKHVVDTISLSNFNIKRITGEFWTSKQRQASSIHEVSYRACFKPQLPNYFIEKYTKEGDVVYDPFGGRGTPFKDITEPVMVIDKNVIYKTIPGTPYKDITEPLMVIEKNGIYPVIPGTTLRDYSEMPGFVIE